MIQRLQTLFLGLAAIIFLILPFIPIAHLSGVNFEIKFNLFRLIKISTDNTEQVIGTNYILILLTSLSTALVLFTIFQYKNRAQQIMFAYGLMIIIAVFISSEIWLIQKATTDLNITTKQYQLGIVLPIVAIVLVYLAIQRIKKDEELVRSADRLR
ncbi:MAG: DUF4293 domain-containing protein [Bacteroidia bacterium]|nr:DUF4293 domain-containing protein [Bacteroidia bacterium]